MIASDLKLLVIQEGRDAAGNRSWYSRLGVEKVMGFCTHKQYKSFFTEVESFENGLIEGGFIILKYYLDISKEEKQRRFDDRKKNPLKQMEN